MMPHFVQNTLTLLDDALTWILILIPSTASLMIAYHAWRKKMADGEPGEMEQRDKKMKTILVAAVIGMSAASIVKAILAYYQ